MKLTFWHSHTFCVFICIYLKKNEISKQWMIIIFKSFNKIREYVFVQSLYWSNSKIRALSILLSFSNERINSMQCQWFYRHINYVFEYIFAQSFRRSIRKSLHYSILMSFIYWWSRLMHIFEQKRNHSNTKSFSIEIFSKNVIFKKNEIIRTRNFSRCQKFEFAISFWFEIHSNTKLFSLLKSRIRNFFLIWNLFEHEIFACRLNYRIFIWSHRNDLKNHYNRDFRIW